MSHCFQWFIALSDAHSGSFQPTMLSGGSSADRAQMNTGLPRQVRMRMEQPKINETNRTA